MMVEYLTPVAAAMSPWLAPSPRMAKMRRMTGAISLGTSSPSIRSKPVLGRLIHLPWRTACCMPMRTFSANCSR